jgi:colicin import membrane protein
VALIRSYALPLFAALAFHAGVGLVFVRGFTASEDIAQVITPKVVNATLMVVEPPAQNKRPPAPAKPAPAAPVANKPSAAERKRLVEEQLAAEQAKRAEQVAKDRAEAQRQKKQRQKELEAQRRRERLAALGDLADDSLQQSLEAEAEQIQDNDVQQQVQTFQAGIYDLVRKNWSRPPSARNGMQVRFLVELIPTGELLSVTLVDSSGSAAFDRSAEQAIRRARRFDVPQDNSVFEANFRRFYFLFRPEDLLR